MFNPRVDELWLRYCDVFEDKWGLPSNVCATLGHMGKLILDAEFREHGPKAYETSIVQPIRNAYYMAHNILVRAKKLERFDLKPPILDYGCGVGFTLAWLAQDRKFPLYGYEPAGVQRDFIQVYGKEFGFTPWMGEPVNTVLCFNVLEHLPDPLGTLDYLYSLTPNVIGNCATDHDTVTHTLDDEAHAKVNEILRARGGHIEPA